MTAKDSTPSNPVRMVNMTILQQLLQLQLAVQDLTAEYRDSNNTLRLVRFTDICTRPIPTEVCSSPEFCE